MSSVTACIAIVIGVGMIFQWTASYLKQQIPELRTEPIRIAFHIVAEMLTAVCLIVAGIALLMSMEWGRSLYLVAAGMLFYTSVVSPGYFAQQGKWAWLLLFGVVIAMGFGGIVLLW